jgi:hypothetical protein
VVEGAGRKAKRMVLQCINGEFKSRRGKNKNLTALKSNSNTVWFNFQTYIYIYRSLEDCATISIKMLQKIY